MVKIFYAIVFLMAFSSTNAAAYGEEMTFGEFLSDFDYVARKEMKIDSEALVKGLKQGKLHLIDIRFKEEFEAWRMGFAKNIPLNELPGRLKELPKDKTIVTACPHMDRAILAMAYLRTQGFDSQYLTDGLTGLAEHLRGDKARDFVNQGIKSPQ
jgi:rhodanese-related sulfurtransferase